MKKFLYVLLLAPCFAQAASMLELDNDFSGAAPKGNPPWLTATFSQAGANSVQLNLTSGLISGEFLSKFSLNLNPLFNPSDLNVSFSSGVQAASIALGTDAFKMDGDGFYDLLLTFDNAPPSARFGAGSVSTYLLSGILGLTPESFSFVDAGGSKGDFYAAAHIQNIGRSGESGWIGADDIDSNNTVSEPSALALLGIGLLAVGLISNRKPSQVFFEV